MTSSKFTYETYIRTTPEQLWRALTEAEFTRQYWAETWPESSWEPGASWRLMIPGGRLGDSGQILEIEPCRRLVHTLQVEIDESLRAEGPSRVTYELEPVGTSVKLTFKQEIDRPDSMVIATMSQGWPHLLASLKSLLETGKALEETSRWPEGH